MNASVQKYKIIRIKNKLYPVKKYDCTYLTVHGDGRMNRQSNGSGLNRPTNVLFLVCNVQTKNNNDDKNNNQLYEHSFW